MTDIALALGSNLGDRAGHLARCVAALEGRVTLVATSSVYESPAAIYADQPDFLNVVVLGLTDLAPRKLLDFIQHIEAQAGRQRSFRAAPRTLDIDILFFGRDRIREAGLSIPHPGWRDRAFVLAPLAEVAPAMVDPESGLTVEELWRRRAPHLDEVRRLHPLPSLREIP